MVESEILAMKKEMARMQEEKTILRIEPCSLKSNNELMFSNLFGSLSNSVVQN